MSKLTDLAIKKLAMRKEAAVHRYSDGSSTHAPYTIPDADRLGVAPIEWADLYSRFGYNIPEKSNDPSEEGRGFYSTNTIKQLTRYPRQYVDETLRLNDQHSVLDPLNRHRGAYATKTGYLDSKSANNNMRHLFNMPEDFYHYGVESQSPISNRLAYFGSPAERRDKMIAEGWNNVKKRDLSTAALGGLGASVLNSVLNKVYKKQQPKK